MINPEHFIKFLEENNFSLITGVPCSYFKEFLDYLEIAQGKIKHIYATREDEAVGIASGATFAHKRTLVYMQNSGLGNIGDALTSLAQLYNLPMLLLVSWRGLEPDKDFPEHSLMGEVTKDVFKAYDLPFLELGEKDWREEMEKAIVMMEEMCSPVALLVKKGVLCK